MPRAPFVLSFLAMLTSGLVLAQQTHKTDAEQDWFAGPIQTVSTTSTPTGVKLEAHNGFKVAGPIASGECSYDRFGNKTRSGEIVDGKLVVSEPILVLDANGQVLERTVTNAFNGEPYLHELGNSFGVTSQTVYDHGNVLFQSFTLYDPNGHVSDGLSLDGVGKQLSRFHRTTTKDGVLTENSDYDKEDNPRSRLTYDPGKDETRFVSYDDAGDLQFSYVYARGEVISFWGRSDASQHGGTRIFEHKDDGDTVFYECHQTLPCERAVVHPEYLSPNKRNPRKVELRDSEGYLLQSAEYEYELDSYQNWTHRKVWVWSPALGQRTLFEEDSRTLTYWQK